MVLFIFFAVCRACLYLVHSPSMTHRDARDQSTPRPRHRGAKRNAITHTHHPHTLTLTLTLTFTRTHTRASLPTHSLLHTYAHAYTRTHTGGYGVCVGSHAEVWSERERTDSVGRGTCVSGFRVRPLPIAAGRSEEKGMGVWKCVRVCVGW